MIIRFDISRRHNYSKHLESNSFITHDEKSDRKKETDTFLLEIKQYVENHDGLGKLQH